MPSVRTVGAIVIGLIVGVALITLVELAGLALHPLPEGFDPGDREAVKAHAAQAPPLARVVVVAAWTLGALGGTFTASRLGSPGQHAYSLATGGLLLVGTVVTLFQIPSGPAMTIAGLVLPPLGSVFGCFLGRRPAGPDAEEAAPLPL